MIDRSQCKSGAYEPTFYPQSRRPVMSQEKGSLGYEPSQLVTQPTGRGFESGTGRLSLSLYLLTTYSFNCLVV
jgi:hypothetical protein